MTDDAAGTPAPTCPPITPDGAAFQRTVYALDAWPLHEPLSPWCLKLITARPERSPS